MSYHEKDVEVETPHQLRARLQNILNDIEHEQEIGSKPKYSKLQSYVKSNSRNYQSIYKDQINCNTSEDKELIELQDAIKHYEKSRDILNDLLDRKLNEHSMYYWMQRGIGSAQVQKLKYHRDGLQITTLINTLQRML
jgi:hypothetical protein